MKMLIAGLMVIMMAGQSWANATNAAETGARLKAKIDDLHLSSGDTKSLKAIIAQLNMDDPISRYAASIPVMVLKEKYIGDPILVAISRMLSDPSGSAVHLVSANAVDRAIKTTPELWDKISNALIYSDDTQLRKDLVRIVGRLIPFEESSK